ncbi:hypothetical protein [Nostoc sp. FACHB-888]|uniref:hypothetical protein n=1 Tax=Nostoc sp. FACHB-888 TaxID=2692842 RepID=UPI0016883440|nr:hypothetical protein [Nostoc sp. FACHB-888]MBD2247673.1 hypothetical protein [Nostoc sp. FACHB-888]
MFLSGARYEITDEAVIQEIWRLSSAGLPLLIGMMSQSIPTNKNLILDPCDEAVERFLKWELDATKHQLQGKRILFTNKN